MQIRDLSILQHEDVHAFPYCNSWVFMPLFIATRGLAQISTRVTNIVSVTLSMSLSHSWSLSNLFVSSQKLLDLREKNAHPISK
jgi:hypothetical protein